MSTTWNHLGESIVVTTETTSFGIKLGDFIKMDGFPLGVRVDEFVGKDPAGPMGMVYRPWLGDKFADFNFGGLRGNPCFIICYPVGFDHYGQHIQWDTVQLCSVL